MRILLHRLLALVEGGHHYVEGVGGMPAREAALGHHAHDFGTAFGGSRGHSAHQPIVEAAVHQRVAIVADPAAQSGGIIAHRLRQSFVCRTVYCYIHLFVCLIFRGRKYNTYSVTLYP